MQQATIQNKTVPPRKQQLACDKDLFKLAAVADLLLNDAALYWACLVVELLKKAFPRWL